MRTFCFLEIMENPDLTGSVLAPYTPESNYHLQLTSLLYRLARSIWVFGHGWLSQAPSWLLVLNTTGKVPEWSCISNDYCWRNLALWVVVAELFPKKMWGWGQLFGVLHGVDWPLAICFGELVKPGFLTTYSMRSTRLCARRHVAERMVGFQKSWFRVKCVKRNQSPAKTGLRSPTVLLFFELDRLVEDPRNALYVSPFSVCATRCYPVH